MEAVRRKDDRVSIRLEARQKSVIDRAARLTGVSRSGFMLANAVDAAARVVEQQSRIELSERDWARFIELVSSDAEPTPAARQAAERYRRA